jgi:tRNA A37 N6-isopentenylltransferase MiaA
MNAWPIFGDGSRARVVVGTSGAGKTTLALELAAILNVPHIELDALHWGREWSVRPDFAERVVAAVAARDAVGGQPRIDRARCSTATACSGG